MAGQGRGLVADALHQAAVAGDDVRVVIDDLRILRVLHALGESEADTHGEALAQWAGGGLDADGVAVLRVARRARSQLPEVAQLRRRQPVVEDVQEPVEQRRAVAGGEHEPVAVGPLGVGRVVLEVPAPERPRHRRRTHRHAGVAAVGGLHHVGGQEAERVDGQLVVHESCPPADALVASARSVLTAAAFPSAYAVHPRSRDEDVSAGGGSPGDRCVGDAAVDLQFDGVPRFIDHATQLSDLGLDGGDVLLAAEARVDRHRQDEVDLGQHVRDDVGGRVRVERHPAASPEVADPPQRAVQMRAGLGVDDDELAARLDVAGEELVGIDHHEVSLELHRAVRLRGGDDVGAEGQVRDEDAVHDIPLDAVDAGLAQLAHLVAQAGEVRRKNGGNDQRISHVTSQPIGAGRDRRHRVQLWSSPCRQALSSADATRRCASQMASGTLVKPDRCSSR